MKKEKNFELEANGMIVFGISMVAGVINYLYQIVMGNMMTPEEYGLLNTLLSLTLVLSVPSGTLGIVALKYSSHFAAKEEYEKIAVVYKKLFAVAVLCAAVTMLAGIIGIDYITGALKIDNKTCIIIALVAACLAYIVQVGSGIIQGLKKFISYSFISILNALCKIIFGVVVLVAGLSIYGMTFTFVLATFATIVYEIVILKKYIFPLGKSKGKLENINIYGYIKYIFWTQIFLSFITTGDTLLIKMFTDEYTVGLYSTASVFCKISYYFANSIAATLLPIVSQEHAKGNKTYNLFIRSIIYGTGVSLIGATGISIFGGFAIKLLFGSDYLAAAQLFIPTSVFIVALNLVTILINYQTAVNDMRILTVSLMLGLAATVGLVLIFHSNITQIIYSISVGIFAIFAVNFVDITIKNKKASEF